MRLKIVKIRSKSEQPTFAPAYQVVDAETGSILKGVSFVRVELDHLRGIKATIEFYDPDVEIRDWQEGDEECA